MRRITWMWSNDKQCDCVYLSLSLWMWNYIGGRDGDGEQWGNREIV